MIVLIDNYDSFTYNVVQLAAQFDDDLRVFRNDACQADDILNLHPDGIILSPGPGRPEDAGMCIELIRLNNGRIPLLGICLGEQAIAKAYGADIIHASRRMHGKCSLISRQADSPLFDGLDNPFPAARYHSLAAANLPDCLQVTALCDGEIMALQHKSLPVYGLQFHPESIMTPDGALMMKNFVDLCRAHACSQAQTAA